MSRWSRNLSRSVMAVMSVVVVGTASISGVVAHSPDPTFSGALFDQDQQVGYRWRAGQWPPDWMRGAINAAADDSNDSRRSRAATFAYDSGSDSLIAYDEPTPCGALGAACTNRANAPDSFNMWYRRQGYPFDWGSMRWCQAYSNAPDGCYDAEAIALHEFGHVEVLAHHEMLGNESDFLDSIMETTARTKPRAGYNAYLYARCDLATLQRKYDLQGTGSSVARCQSLDTTLSLSTNDTSIEYRGTVTFTAVLRISSNSGGGKLSGDALSDRDVILQRRVPDGTWATVGSMADAASGGGYVLSQAPTVSYEWRAWFGQPDNEGIQGAISAGVTVTVVPCTVRVCPNIGHD